MGTMTRVPLRAAWNHEASEFTPWLAESQNLDALAEALELSELILVSTEHSVGDFKLDILCKDGEEEEVIIENQLEDTNHKHLGQILAYAAGVGAKKVIWIARSFRAEHAAALHFLNENTTDELAFFGVQIEVWRIGDSLLAPKFEVVVKPDNWTKTERMQARVAAESSPTGQLQLKFWNAFIGHLREEAPNIILPKPQPKHWISASIGRSGFHLSVTAKVRHDSLGVELYISGPGAKNRFAALLPKRERVEKELGFELDWQELPDSIACRIITLFPKAPLENEQRWPKYFEWITDRLVKMDKVFRPLIKDL